jgi:hypothetical protein
MFASQQRNQAQAGLVAFSHHHAGNIVEQFNAGFVQCHPRRRIFDIQVRSWNKFEFRSLHPNVWQANWHDRFLRVGKNAAQIKVWPEMKTRLARIGSRNTQNYSRSSWRVNLATARKVRAMKQVMIAGLLADGVVDDQQVEELKATFEDLAGVAVTEQDLRH